MPDKPSDAKPQLKLTLVIFVLEPLTGVVKLGTVGGIVSFNT